MVLVPSGFLSIVVHNACSMYLRGSRVSDALPAGYTRCVVCGNVIRDFVAGSRGDRCPMCGFKQGCCDGV